MRSNSTGLWPLVFGTPEIDPGDLLAGIESELASADLDFRTRLLLRDSYDSLVHRWGQSRVDAVLTPGARSRIQSILNDDLGLPGFSTLKDRLVNATSPETILRFLRELAESVRSPARLGIGGSSSLILQNRLRRSTVHVDAVDEIPESIRSEFELLGNLSKSYGLQLTHFQSHYLPAGWRDRLESFARFGFLDVFLVAEWDIVIGKLFSNRQKDRDDLRALLPEASKTEATSRLRGAGIPLLAEPKLRANAEKNWRILFGEELPA